MESDGSQYDSIVETSDLDSNATVSPMLPGLNLLFERHSKRTPERNEDFSSPIIPLIDKDILMDSVHSLQDETTSQESDVLINLNVTMCRPLSQGKSSTRVALNFAEATLKNLAEKNTLKDTLHDEGIRTVHDDNITTAVICSPCRRSQNEAKQKDNNKGCDPDSWNRLCDDNHGWTAAVGNVSQMKGDKKLTASNGGDSGVGLRPVLAPSRHRVNIDEDITIDKKNEGNSGCHGDVDDGTEKKVFEKQVCDETTDCRKECELTEETQYVTTDDTVTSCDSDTLEQVGCVTHRQAGGDNPEDSDKQDDTQVDKCHGVDTEDTYNDGGVRENSDTMEERETEGTYSPSLLGPPWKTSLQAHHVADTRGGLSRNDTQTNRPDNRVEVRSRGWSATPCHLPLSGSSSQSRAHATRHKSQAKAVKRHEQEMMVLNKVETQLTKAESALTQEDENMNETVAKTLSVFKPLLGQLTRSQKQERDRIEHELSTDGAIKLTKEHKSLLVTQTRLLHERQRCLVMLVQQHRHLVGKSSSLAARRDQPINGHEASQRAPSARDDKEDDINDSSFCKKPQLFDLRQLENTTALVGRYSLNTTQGVAVTTTTTMVTKNKNPPDGTSSGIVKKQKTSAAFRVPHKEDTATQDPGNGGNVFSEPQQTSRDSGVYGQADLSRTTPNSLPLKLRLQGCKESGQIEQDSCSATCGIAKVQPTKTVTATATSRRSVCRPLVALLTSDSAAASTQVATSSNPSQSKACGQQILLPAAVMPRNLRQTSWNSSAVGTKVVPPSVRNHEDFQQEPRHAVSYQQQLQPAGRNTGLGVRHYPSLKMLIDIGLLSPGKNIFTIQIAENTVLGSLLPNGYIEGAGGVIYKTPIGWCKAVLANEINPNSIKKKIAYQRVLHDDKPLARFKLVTKTIGGTCPDGDIVTCENMKHGYAQGRNRGTSSTTTTTTNMGALMGKCYVTLISDSELFLSKSFLPSNFWDTPGFKGTNLSRELIDSIESW